MTAVTLSDRAIIDVTGDDRETFLDGLLSTSVADLAPGALRYGALLTPQGKIVSDLFVFAEEDRLRLDVPAIAAADLVKRFTLYKLRAKVTVSLSDDAVLADPEGATDPRAPGLLGRVVGAGAGADRAPYDAARITAGVPDAVRDFALGETFPHDANMDLTGGVDFRKGCFVGQEVVSRMRHRGTARRRTVIVTAQTPLPEGAEIVAGEKAIGRLGTVVGTRGLAIVRIDRADRELTADGTPVHLAVPDGAPFALPERA